MLVSQYFDQRLLRQSLSSCRTCRHLRGVECILKRSSRWGRAVRCGYLCSSTLCWIWWWRLFSTCVLFHTHWSPSRWRCCPSFGRTGHSSWELHAPLPRKNPVATLHGRLPASPGSLAHNRLSHSSGTVETFLQTSEYFGKLQTLHKLLSDTCTLFSHWPNELTLSQNISRCTKLNKEHTKNTLKVANVLAAAHQL